MCNSPQRVYILCGVQRRCVWAVERLGVAACLACVVTRGGGGRQAGATVLSCLVWRCELSVPDRPTGSFCVGVLPAVALRRRHTSTQTRYRTHLSGGRADSIHTATPGTIKQSCLLNFDILSYLIVWTIMSRLYISAS